VKRNIDLIRELLFITEKSHRSVAVWTIKIKGISAETIDYHAYLLQDGGYIKADIEQLEDDTFDTVLIHSLTWSGHELLDSIRKDQIWEKVKNRIAEKTESVPFDILKQIAMEYIEALI